MPCPVLPVKSSRTKKVNQKERHVAAKPLIMRDFIEKFKEGRAGTSTVPALENVKTRKIRFLIQNFCNVDPESN
jgi:hypothetical protein